MFIIARTGDTLKYFSRLFQIPLSILETANEEIGETLEKGEKIAVPGYIKRPCRLEPGESIWSLITDHMLPLDALLLLNPELNPHHPEADKEIQVPRKIEKPFIKMNHPYDSRQLENDIKKLTALYPIFNTRTIGESADGKPIYELKIGNGEKRVHWNASFHAREWMTSLIVMRFINEYLSAVTHHRAIRGVPAHSLFDQTSLSVVPMVNPDGVDLAINGMPDDQNLRTRLLAMNGGSRDFSLWKANIMGVDLNDQFPANWDEEAERLRKDPAPADYPGKTPLSEPEAKAMARLVHAESFDHVIAFHTQGEVIYWGYEGRETEASRHLVYLFSELSGYDPVQYVDSHAGFKDWFIQETGRPGFTVECGEGKHPLALAQAPEIYQETLGIFLASLYAE